MFNTVHFSTYLVSNQIRLHQRMVFIINNDTVRRYQIRPLFRGRPIARIRTLSMVRARVRSFMHFRRDFCCLMAA